MCTRVIGAQFVLSSHLVNAQISRNNFEHLVNRVPHASHKGFDVLEEARAAYTIACALGFVQAIPSRLANGLGPDPGLSLVSTTPSQEEILAALNSTYTHPLGGSWYTVTKGVRPGVYPCWSVFMSPLLACKLTHLG